MTTMKLIDREYWLIRVGDLTKAVAATADIFPHHEGSLVSAQCPLSSAVTDRLKQVAGNSELLTWAILAAVTSIVLRRIGGVSSVVLHINTEQGKRLPVTPIQQWFFEQRFSEQHHWNQSHVISTTEPLNAEALSLAIQSLVEHHEQLRVCFPKEKGKHYQALRSPYDNLLWFAEPDCSEETIANEAHASLSIEEGPLLRIVMLDDFRVLLTLHHLIVDQVSWQILLEDLETAYQAIIQKET
ncbi:condensation domain-containing protein [Photorhabdus laumondii]|uniref:condensation domain-containing protein n=1 Tax=Photorhabdus laumondii TaxID=2218628 RepID=UPI0033150284